MPLETLPGWPAVTEPTTLELLVLMVFLPLAGAAVITLLTLGPSWKRSDRG